MGLRSRRLALPKSHPKLVLLDLKPMTEPTLRHAITVKQRSLRTLHNHTTVCKAVPVMLVFVGGYLDRFCRGAGHTFIHTRTVTSRMRVPIPAPVAGRGRCRTRAKMSRRDLIEESALLSAMHGNGFSPEAPLAKPLDVEAGEDSLGAAAGLGSRARRGCRR